MDKKNEDTNCSGLNQSMNKLTGGAQKNDRRFQNRRVALHDQKNRYGSDNADRILFKK